MTAYNEIRGKYTVAIVKKGMKSLIKNQGKTQLSFCPPLKENKYLIGSAGLNSSDHNYSAEHSYMALM